MLTRVPTTRDGVLRARAGLFTARPRKDIEIAIQKTARSEPTTAAIRPAPRQSASDPRTDRFELGAIALGGAVGALARVGVARTLPSTAGHWPWATFAVNVAGALMLGYFVTRLQERLPVSTLRRPLLATGLCGALTTFSTVQIELLRMIDGGHYGLAGAYLATSVLGGYLAVFLSSALVRRVRVIA